MAYLATNPTNLTDGGTLELDGASSVTSADVGGFTYIFVAGADDNGISVFRLNANGTLTAIFDVSDSGSLNLVGARGLSTTTVNGNTYLFVAGFGDSGVSVFRVNTAGGLVPVADVADDATLRLAGAADTAAISVGGATYLFVAGQTDDGISSFRVAGDGRLTGIANTADTGTIFLDGVRTLATVTVGGTAFLIAGGSVDNGISVFSVSAAGALTAVTNLADSATLRLAGASDITTAVIGSTTYVYVAGATDNGVSVFTLSAAGVLTNIDNETDSAATLVAGANSVAVHTIGSTSYLLVGGNENGLSLYRIENGGNNSTAGTLTFVENLADSGSRELSGVTSVHGASVGGTSYILGAGFTDDGVSTFGAGTTGQIWYATEGNLADARIAYFNTDGSNPTSLFDNAPSTELTTGFIESVVVDSAAGLFYALVTGNEGINARIIMGRIGSATPPTVVFTFDPTFAGAENNLAFNLEIDTITHRLYAGYIEFSPTFDPTTQGIRQFDYNTTSGAVTGGTYFVRDSTALTAPSTAGADGLFASQDFEIDGTRNVAYTQNLAVGDNFETNAILRFNLTTPGGAAGVSVVNQSQFQLNNNANVNFTTTNGIIADIEIDRDSDRLYFLTRSPQVDESGVLDSIWMVAGASTAVNATPVKLTLVGITLSDFYPEDMTLDEVNNILYVESENSNLVGGGITDVLLVFQLDAAGTTATLINTIPMAFGTTANIEALHFNHLVTLGALSGTGTAITEQGGAVDLLTAAPTIADFDGDRLSSATVQVTGGRFSSNENSSADDSLGHSAAMTQSGLIAGTNITISWNAATSTLTLTGYDTFANYQAALNAIHFRSSGDNPTNYGLNPTRTLTWTISDGLPNIPGGSRNSGTTQITITAINDAPVNTVGATLAATEDATVNVTGMSVSDPDANPGITDIVVSFTVTNGTIAFLTNVAGGITAGDITGGANGTTTITVTATQNEINATLAATGGLTFTPTANYNGNASLTVVTNDNGNTGNDPGLSGTGTTEQDSDVRTITIAAVNDAPVATGASVATGAILEDTPSAAGFTVATYFGPLFSDATDQVAGGSSANLLAGIAITTNAASANGAWQYFNGAIWVDIATGMTAATAVTISAATAIRFNPAANFNGISPAMTVTLVDDSGGALTNAAVVNASVTGTTTRFSAGSVTIAQPVQAVNDAPTSTGLQGDGVTTTEPAGASSVMPNVKIDAGGNATISEVALDNVNFNGGSIRFAITTGLVAAQDQLVIDTAAATTVTVAGGVVSVGGTAIGTVTGGGAGGADLVVTLTNLATPALVQTLIRAIDFANTGGDNPTAGLRTITTTLVDGGGTANLGTDTLVLTSTVTVFAANDTPTITGLPASIPAFNPGVPGIVDLSASTIADADNATVTVLLSSSAPGTFLTATVAGITIAGAANAPSLTGTVAAINAYFDTASNVQFAPGLLNGPFSVFVTVSDGVANTGALQIPSSITFTPETLTTGFPATQNFGNLVINGAGTVTPLGWTFSESSGSVVYAAGTGSSATGDTYSFGAVGNGDRAFGTVRSGTNVPTIGGAFTNTSGVSLTSLVVAYTGEQWRLGATGRVDQLDFQISFDATSLTTGTWQDVNALDFVAPVTAGTVGALDGNLAGNRTAITSEITGLSIANGATFWIRWLDADATGSDDGLAVDDFSITARAVAAVNDAGAVSENATILNGNLFTNDVNQGGGPALVVGSVNGVAGNVGNQITLASGALVTVRANGTYDYNPNGQFNTLIDAATALATGAVNDRAFDTFTYTLTGGSTATVTVRVNGVTSAGDQLQGGAGNSNLTGTAGVDTFNLTLGGNDTVSGGDSNDAFIFGGTFDALDTVDGGAGNNDQVGLSGNYSGGIVLGPNTLTNIEVLAALPGNSYNITSNDGNVAAGQTLSIFGGNLAAGNDFTFNGSAETNGMFRMYGGLGNDTFTGGALDDGFYFGPGKWGAGDSVTGGGGTNDQLALDGDYTIGIGANAGVETLILLPGPAGTPNNFNISLFDVWTGAGATKTVWGLNVTTSMTIDGTAEADGNLILFGGQASDNLYGGAGADAIYGGGGGDFLFGGAGADVFRYDAVTESSGATNATRDRIVDFASGSDKIDLSRIDAVTGGADDAFSFIGTGAFTNTAGQLRYTAVSASNFIVEGDVNGDGIADFTLSVTTIPATPPLATDFIL